VKVTKGDSSTALGLEVSGLDKGYYSDVTDAEGNVTGSILQAEKPDFGVGLSIDLSLDGVTKTIDLNGVEGRMVGGKYVVTADDLLKTLEKEVKSAFGEYVTVNLDKTDPNGKFLTFGLNITDADGNIESGHELRITGLSTSKLGISPGSSTQFSTSQTLAELGAGDHFAFTINDVDFSFDGHTTVANMINQINRSSAGVKISYSTMSELCHVLLQCKYLQQMVWSAHKPQRHST